MLVGNFIYEMFKFCCVRKIFVLVIFIVICYIKSNDRRNFCYDGNMEKVDIFKLFRELRLDVLVFLKVIYFVF